MIPQVYHNRFELHRLWRWGHPGSVVGLGYPVVAACCEFFQGLFCAAWPEDGELEYFCGGAETEVDHGFTSGGVAAGTGENAGVLVH